MGKRNGELGTVNGETATTTAGNQENERLQAEVAKWQADAETWRHRAQHEVDQKVLERLQTIEENQRPPRASLWERLEEENLVDQTKQQLADWLRKALEECELFERNGELLAERGAEFREQRDAWKEVAGAFQSIVTEALGRDEEPGEVEPLPGPLGGYRTVKELVREMDAMDDVDLVDKMRCLEVQVAEYRAKVQNYARADVQHQRENVTLVASRDGWKDRALAAEKKSVQDRDLWERELEDLRANKDAEIAGLRQLLVEAQREVEGLTRLDMRGASLIAAERLRQVTEEGYSLEGDARDNDEEQLAIAAALYATPRAGNWPWPWDEASDKRPRDTDGFLRDNNTLDAPARVRQLEKAGAFVAAEIDRLLRIVNGELGTVKEDAPTATGHEGKWSLDEQGVA